MVDTAKLLQILFDGSHDAVAVWSIDRFIIANRSAARLFGFTSSDAFTLAPPEMLIAPSDRGRVFAGFWGAPVGSPARVIKGGGVRVDGSTFALEINLTIVPFEGESFLLTTFDNVEERDLTKTALADSERNYHLLFENMMAGFALHEMVYDASGKAVDYRFLDVNPLFERLTGTSREAVVGKTVLEVMPETERYWIDTYAKVAATGEPLAYENYSSAIGKWFDIWCFSPEKGKFAVVFTDITEKKEAAENLRMNEERLLLATQAAGIGTWDWNVAKNELVWDKSMYTLYGIREEDFGGAFEAWSATIHPDDREAALAASQGALCGDGEYDTEFRIVRPDGAIRSIKGDAKTFFDDGGNALRMIGVNYDVTDRRQAEGERIHLESQLMQAQKMESVGRLAGGVAHDFNNMLGVILGHSELALSTISPGDPTYIDLEEIRKAGQRSADLTRQLLAFARKQTATPRDLDLNETIGGMQKMLKRLIGEDVDLVWSPGENLWPVFIDPSQIDQILANLVVNARDAIARTGSVVIKTRNDSFDEAFCRLRPDATPGEYVLMSVSDTGVGMDRETMSHLFEPFFTTKEVGKGTGLGLSTVYGIVRQNLGTVNVQSEPGKGTTFQIYLPRWGGRSGVASEPEKASVDHVHGVETILLVEDEPAILKIAKMILERHGYVVIGAGTPSEAVDEAMRHQSPIHLLLTDVVMPGMNGKELKELLEVGRPCMKTLYMSGYPADVIVRQGLIHDGVDLIAKPFSVSSLISKVREILDRVD